MKVCMSKKFIGVAALVLILGGISYAEENTAALEAIATTPIQKEKKAKKPAKKGMSKKSAKKPKVCEFC